MSILKPFVTLLVLTALIQTAEAQQTIRFKSGDYTPAANTDKYMNDDGLFEQQLFFSRWYGVWQFNTLLSETQQHILKQQGVVILGYIPNNAYIIIAPASFNLNIAQQAGLSSAFLLHPEHKTTKTFYHGEIPEWAKSTSETVDITVELFEYMAPAQFIKTVKAQNISLLSEEPTFNKLTLRVGINSIQSVLASPVVLWAQPVAPKITSENVPGKNVSRSNVLTDGFRNLTGKNVKMGIWDGGVVGPHIDFMNRLSVVEPGTASDHATHVAGTMAGAGNIDPKARGMAPKAQIFGYDFNGAIASEINNSILTNEIVVSQHSYGYGDAWVNCTSKDPYVTESREQDLTVYNNPYFMHVHSAGNSQGVCAGGWGTTTGKAAKNILVVANVSSTEAINSSSSFGPVNDGRLKPEISAVGVSVYSTGPNNGYLSGYTGTSMATPVVSGVSAQLYERYRQLNGNLNPQASLLKAIMCNTAKDVGTAGPDYKYGYGVLNGLKAVKTLESSSYNTGYISQGTTDYASIVIPANATRVKVMISWTDVAALANANPALVNDLDLVVRDPNSAAVLPWVLNAAIPANAATRGVDRLNNTEQVTIDNPTPGTYQLEVTGFAIPLGPQAYAITWEIETPFMTLTYPMGGEHFVPGSTSTIHWDNAGVTGTQTLQYSTNGGANWTTLSSSIASTAKQYDWAVPAALTGVKVLMRISNGTLTDDSDSAFSIIGTPASLTFSAGCVSGETKVTWPTVTGATHYDILVLNSLTGDWDTATHDVAGLTGTVIGLTPGNSYWFAVLARNNTAGAIGERSLAQNYTQPSTPPPPAVIIESVTSSGPTLCQGGSTTLTAITKVSQSPLANYIFTTNTTGSLDPMSGATTVLSAGNDNTPSSLINIGFSFNLNQTGYTTLTASPDGWVKLGTVTTTAQAVNSVTSTTNIPKIYPFWDDLATGLNGNVQTVLTGTAPNRIFIVQWFVTLPRNTTGSANTTFQLWLYETSNNIEFRYGTMGTTTTATASAGITVGASIFRSITFSSNTQSSSTANNSNSTPPANGRLYAFTLPAASNITWSPSSYLTSTSGASVNVQNIPATTNYTITATDANTGCSVNTLYSLFVATKPKVGFTINNTTQPRNTNAFVLTDTTAGNWLTRTWTYGDGNTATTNPVTKTYAAIGSYNVKLKVLNTLYGCTDSIQKQVNVIASTPTVFASNLQVSAITGTSMQLNWTNGNGQQRIVLAKLNAPVNTSLVDNNTYTANTQFGAGTQLADGSYVVYQGTGNTTTVTALSPLANYHYAVVEMSIDNGANIYQPLPYLTSQATTLPVIWLSFDVSLNRHQKAELVWTTASEVNNMGFEVERSEDANRWVTLGMVKGNGTTAHQSMYTYTDETLTKAQVLYYRLKQIDFNSAVAYSPVRSLYLKQQAVSFIVYPNPSNQLIYIDHQEGAGLELEIINLSGKVVYHHADYVSGNAIDVKDLANGLYTVRLLRDHHQVHVEKLAISH